MQTILITGCSSGIGLIAARTLKARGWRVFAAARKTSDIEKLQAKGFECVQLDLNDSDSIRTSVDSIIDKTDGRLDALFNNAGFLQAGAVEDLTREMDRQQFETNVFGQMELIRAVLPIMRKQKHGRIIQNGSILGIITLPYCGSYNASKFAIEGYCNTLRQELRGSRISISILNPGPITSKLRHNAYEGFEETVKQTQGGVHEKIYEQLETSYFRAEKQDDFFTMTPEAVCKPLIHALESKHPKSHYYVGIAAKGMAFLKRILPDTLMDWVLARVR